MVSDGPCMLAEYDIKGGDTSQGCLRKENPQLSLVAFSFFSQQLNDCSHFWAATHDLLINRIPCGPLLPRRRQEYGALSLYRRRVLCLSSTSPPIHTRLQVPFTIDRAVMACSTDSECRASSWDASQFIWQGRCRVLVAVNQYGKEQCLIQLEDVQTGHP